MGEPSISYIEKSNSASTIAIVIPCYNECATISPIIERCIKLGDVIVVDDGSSDESARLSLEAGAQVIRTNGRAGYQGAIEIGLSNAHSCGYDFVVTIDADGEHDPSVLEAFIEAHTQGAELVIGFRARPQRFAEWFVCLFCHYFFGINDVLCGMKGYSQAVLATYFADEHSNLVNTWPALLWVSNGGTFKQIAVTGIQRKDQPRFQSILKANFLIAKMLYPIIHLKILSKKAED